MTWFSLPDPNFEFYWWFTYKEFATDILFPFLLVVLWRLKRRWILKQLLSLFKWIVALLKKIRLPFVIVKRKTLEELSRIKEEQEVNDDGKFTQTESATKNTQSSRKSIIPNLAIYAQNSHLWRSFWGYEFLLEGEDYRIHTVKQSSRSLNIYLTSKLSWYQHTLIQRKGEWYAEYFVPQIGRFKKKALNDKKYKFTKQQ